MAVNTTIKTEFVMKGRDQASSVILKTAKSSKELQRELARTQRQLARTNKAMAKTQGTSEAMGQQFAEAGDKVADRSGKLSTALSSLGDFAGKSEGAFRHASEAAGAFDDVLTLLPGPVGLATAAAAGLTTVLVLQAKAAREDEERLKQAFSGELLADVRGLREAFDLSAEASVKLGEAMLDAGKSADDVREDLRAVVTRAEQIGEDGSEAVAKFADELQKGADASDKMRNRLKALGIEVTKFSFATTTAGTALAKFGRDADKDAVAVFSDLAGKLKKAKAELAALEKGYRGPLKKFNDHLGVAGNIAKTVFRSERIRKAEARATRKQTEAIAAQRAEVLRITNDIKNRERIAKGLQNTLKDAAAQERKDTKARAEKEFQEAKTERARLAREKQEAEAEKRRQAAARRARARSRQRAREQAQEKRDLADLGRLAEKYTDEQIKRENAATAAAFRVRELALETAAVQAQADGADALDLARITNKQIELDLEQQIAQVKADAFISEAAKIEQIAAMRRLASTQERANVIAANRAIEEAAAATRAAYLGTAKAGIGALEEIGVAERAIAGLKALSAGAEAFLAFARYDFAAGFAATTAAIQFGKIAATSPEVPTPGGGGGGGPAAAPAPLRQSPASTGGGPTGLTINVTGGLGTPAEVGASVRLALAEAGRAGR